MMKKLSALFLALLTVVSVVIGCKGPDTPSSGTEDPKPVGTDIAELPADQVLELIRDGASEYKIIRGEYCGGNSKTAAVNLNKALTELTGVELQLETDWTKPGETPVISEKEILIGSVEREECKAILAELKEDEYAIRVVGEKLVIACASDLGTLKAVNYFINTYVKGYKEGQSFRVLRTASEKKTFDESVPHTIVKVSKAVTEGLGGTASDSVRLFTGVQGQVNRMFSETDMLLYTIYDSNDEFWLNYMIAEGSSFEGYSVMEIKDKDAFFEMFLPYLKKYGMVLWDPEVPATSNVAVTICGVDGYVPVMADDSAGSLQKSLEKMGVEVRMSLVGMFTGNGTIPDTDIASSGSAKCDAYLWALDKYMAKCSDTLMGYVLDAAGTLASNPMSQSSDPGPFNNQVYNHDYLILNKAFCFDLTPNATEKPCDDKTQPLGTDRDTLCKILEAAYDKANGGFTQVLGFPPWWVKYTDHLGRGNKGGVALEWEFAQLASTYNCPMEADCAHPCCMSNGSAYTMYPIADKFENNTKYDDSVSFEPKTRYFTIYIGDYDSGAWMKTEVPRFWSDPKHGSYAMGWGFNPQLSVRMPVMFEYVYKNKAPLDYFITGDSGAGYINPTALLEGKGGRYLPDGMEDWIAYNEPYLSKFGLDICGFILNGALPFNNEVYNAYSIMTPVGAFSNNGERLVVYNGTPITGETDFTNNENAYNTMKAGGKVTFTTFRTVRKTPTELVEILEGIEDYCNAKNDGYTYMYVGPYEYFDLILQSGQGRHIVE